MPTLTLNLNQQNINVQAPPAQRIDRASQLRIEWVVKAALAKATGSRLENKVYEAESVDIAPEEAVK